MRYKAKKKHNLCAVDLGKYKVGVSLWQVDHGKATLTAAFTFTHRGPPEEVAEIILAVAPVDAVFVCEWPVLYPDKRKYHEGVKACLAVGKALGRVKRWRAKYSPSKWKRNVPKAPHHRRLAKALTREELEIMPDFHEHDTWDAVGIGLYATSRTKAGGSKP